MNTSLSASFSLIQAAKREGEKFKYYYRWLEKNMSPLFFEEISEENLILITHNLMDFDLQDCFSIINRKNSAIGLCLNTPNADLRILSALTGYGIKSYQTYVSKETLSSSGISAYLKIAIIDFTEAAEPIEKNDFSQLKEQIWALVKKEAPSLKQEDFNQCFLRLNTRFLLTLKPDILAAAIYLLHRADSRDNCQSKVRYNEHWKETKTSSMSIVLAWRNTPKHDFLYRLARVFYRYGLNITKVNATYIDPSKQQSILVMALNLHGSNGEAAWDVADIPSLMREICTVKYFEAEDKIDEILVNTGIISGNMGNLLRAMTTFVHQSLVNVDNNLYTVENIEEAFCRHPELTLQLCNAFKFRFDPAFCNLDQFSLLKKTFLSDVAQLDTGHEHNDNRRKNVLYQAMNFIHHTLKTNFYRLNYTALSFRLDPKYLDEIPFERAKKFPELPYAIFFIKGMHFFAFHIRFKDLARGGLRTIYPEQIEQMIAERNNVFTECYNLAWTQQKKNKDIPEGGAKGVIFLQSFSQIDFESPILKKELELLKIPTEEIETRIAAFRKDQKLEYLHQSQRAFVDSLVTIVNCEPDGKIRARFIIDYWNRPEYLYLGPDENMHDSMIEWIANFSKKYHYKPGGAFISSKPKAGINHKEYGITSLGLNVYMHKALKYIGIDPKKDSFTIKMSGGPDGDVAGNQLLNLYRHYPTTAKLIALTDGTGTIRDDLGLDLLILKKLFEQGKGISHYPAEKLSSGGFLVNKEITRTHSAYIKETLCSRKIGDRIIEDWLSGSDTHHILRSNVHHTKTDVFIPAGGRPRSLNASNIEEFLDETGKPTSQIIVEGANLYLDNDARKVLEEKGTLIFKDSSANKGGVICSSFEVLCGLTVDDDTFLKYKPACVCEIIERVKLYATYEADLLLHTHKTTGERLTLISEKISKHINQYTYQLLDYFDTLTLSIDSKDPMINCFLNYCLPTLRENFTLHLLKEIPEHHKKAIIARNLASHIVYTKGLQWSPSIVDILPLLLARSNSALDK